MALRIVASSDLRAIAIRDHILPLVRQQGTLQDLEDKDSSLRLIMLKRDGWVFTHWTPFNSLSASEASSPAYRHALERQRTRSGLPYGLDIKYFDRHVLGVLWSDQAEIEITVFTRGTWEDAALSL